MNRLLAKVDAGLRPYARTDSLPMRGLPSLPSLSGVGRTGRSFLLGQVTDELIQRSNDNFDVLMSVDVETPRSYSKNELMKATCQHFQYLPHHPKGALKFMAPDAGHFKDFITLLFTPLHLTQSLKVQGAGEGGERSEAISLTGPPVETVQWEAALDATDVLEEGDSEWKSAQAPFSESRSCAMDRKGEGPWKNKRLDPSGLRQAGEKELRVGSIGRKGPMTEAELIGDHEYATQAS